MNISMKKMLQELMLWLKEKLAKRPPDVLTTQMAKQLETNATEIECPESETGELE